MARYALESNSLNPPASLRAIHSRAIARPCSACVGPGPAGVGEHLVGEHLARQGLGGVPHELVVLGEVAHRVQAGLVDPVLEAGQGRADGVAQARRASGPPARGATGSSGRRPRSRRSRPGCRSSRARGGSESSGRTAAAGSSSARASSAAVDPATPATCASSSARHARGVTGRLGPVAPGQHRHGQLAEHRRPVVVEGHPQAHLAGGEHGGAADLITSLVAGPSPGQVAGQPRRAAGRRTRSTRSCQPTRSAAPSGPVRTATPVVPPHVGVPTASRTCSATAPTRSSAPGLGTTTRTGRPSTRSRITCRHSRNATCQEATRIGRRAGRQPHLDLACSAGSM